VKDNVLWEIRVNLEVSLGPTLTFQVPYAFISGNIQATFKEHSRNIQGTFKEHSRNIQGTFKEH
jgi:hypothetical protein